MPRPATLSRRRFTSLAGAAGAGFFIGGSPGRAEGPSDRLNIAAIGEVKEAHCWIASSRGMPEVPGAAKTVPAGLDPRP